jgi:hypothetical protein
LIKWSRSRAAAQPGSSSRKHQSHERPEVAGQKDRPPLARPAGARCLGRRSKLCAGYTRQSAAFWARCRALSCRVEDDAPRRSAARGGA